MQIEPQPGNIGSAAPWQAQAADSRAVRVGRHLALCRFAAVGGDGQLVGKGNASANILRVTPMVEVCRLIDADMLVEIEADAIVGTE